MQQKYKSKGGVYYDLSKSPYMYTDEVGNIFKFSSEKKLAMFEAKLMKKEAEFLKEIQYLEKLGFDMKSSIKFVNFKKELPKIVYHDMLYK